MNVILEICNCEYFCTGDCSCHQNSQPCTAACKCDPEAELNMNMMSKNSFTVAIAANRNDID